MVTIVIIVPFCATVVAVPVAWGWGITWESMVSGAVMYAISMLGITVGFHRLFTHRSFLARRGVKIALGVAGGLAIQGPLLRWAADHRRHHAFSDRDGDPHSPWRYGNTFGSLLKGAAYAHLGWFYDREETNQRAFVPDLLNDRDVVVLDRLSAPVAALSLTAPVVLGYLIEGTAYGAAMFFFWAGLVRVFFVHHVTWSVNSICHTIGSRPFETRDRSANVWLLCIPSMGESWHNGHHAMPSSARHGIQRGQLDISAALISALERLGLVTNVKWPLTPPRGARRINLARAVRPR